MSSVQNNFISQVKKFLNPAPLLSPTEKKFIKTFKEFKTSQPKDLATQVPKFITNARSGEGYKMSDAYLTAKLINHLAQENPKKTSLNELIQLLVVKKNEENTSEFKELGHEITDRLTKHLPQEIKDKLLKVVQSNQEKSKLLHSVKLFKNLAKGDTIDAALNVYTRKAFFQKIMTARKNMDTQEFNTEMTKLIAEFKKHIQPGKDKPRISNGNDARRTLDALEGLLILDIHKGITEEANLFLGQIGVRS